jgi:hypothetical protein
MGEKRGGSYMSRRGCTPEEIIVGLREAEILIEEWLWKYAAFGRAVPALPAAGSRGHPGGNTDLGSGMVSGGRPQECEPESQ